jgi:hypothetical protein
MPRALRNDGDHSSTQRERSRPVLARDFQCRSAAEDVNKLVAGEMGFPMILTRELDREKGAVAVGSQSCAAALSILHVDCGVRRNIVSFASSALRSMMLGVPLSISLSVRLFASKRDASSRLAPTFRGSSTSSSITSLGEGVAVISVTPSGE